MAMAIEPLILSFRMRNACDTQQSELCAQELQQHAGDNLQHLLRAQLAVDKLDKVVVCDGQGQVGFVCRRALGDFACALSEVQRPLLLVYVKDYEALRAA